MRTQELLAGMRDEVSSRRASLISEYGFAHYSVSFRLRENEREVIAEGETMLARTWSKQQVGLRSRLPMGWTMRDSVRVLGGTWVQLRGETRLFARSRGPKLATTWCPGDGPCEYLTACSRDGRTAIRVRDGSVGWIDPTRMAGPASIVPLEPACSSPPEELALSANRWKGIPYQLGASSAEAIDCSALVQRTLLAWTGILLPRHSGDQLAIAARPAPAHTMRTGDLVFLWSKDEPARHVGLVLRDGPRAQDLRVLHASTSRRKVVLDSWFRFCEGAFRLRRGPLREIHRWYAKQVGLPSLDANVQGPAGHQPLVHEQQKPNFLRPILPSHFFR